MQIHQAFVQWRLSAAPWWCKNNPESLARCRFPGHGPKVGIRLVWKGQCFKKAKSPAASDHMHHYFPNVYSGTLIPWDAMQELTSVVKYAQECSLSKKQTSKKEKIIR